MGTQSKTYAHAFVAAILPGAGLFFSGSKIEAWVLLVGQLLFAAALFIHSVSDHYVVWVICMLALLCASFVSCFLCLLSMRERGRKRWWMLLALLPVCFLVGCITCSVSSHLAGFLPFQIASESMSPALFVGDKIMVDKTYYSHHAIRDGDVIAFRHGDTVLAKRISALPGETIEGKQGIIYRNGVALAEPYAILDKGSPIDEIETFSVRTVPSGQIFVTGDSRDHSLDSRSDDFGTVTTSEVLGKICFIYSSKHDQTGRLF